MLFLVLSLRVSLAGFEQAKVVKIEDFKSKQER